jgi:Leucine-rich repeat (LRR) protein
VWTETSYIDYTVLSIIKVHNEEIKEILNDISDPKTVSVISIDISPTDHIPSLARFTNLVRLEINDTNLTNLSCLRNNVSLLEELCATGNKIACIEDISTLSNITSVIICNNKIHDIKPLKKIVINLGHLNIENNPISKENLMDFYDFTHKECKPTKELSAIQWNLAKLIHTMTEKEMLDAMLTKYPTL